jgi:hypothetical protein
MNTTKAMAVGCLELSKHLPLDRTLGEVLLSPESPWSEVVAKALQPRLAGGLLQR